jgi:hypothetical protein
MAWLASRKGLPTRDPWNNIKLLYIYRFRYSFPKVKIDQEGNKNS